VEDRLKHHLFAGKQGLGRIVKLARRDENEVPYPHYVGVLGDIEKMFNVQRLNLRLSLRDRFVIMN
jgi:hypothetical protein